jgi:hypothetical protein
MSESLDEIADQLYGIVPSEFVRTRDQQVAAARQRGDRTLATEIKQLRRPTVGAWLVNRLAKERRSDLDRLLQIGHGLRQAQSSLDRDRMRALSEERHAAVGQLSSAARSLAAEAGQEAGEPVLSEVTATLEAAVADEAAAQLVGSGRLTTTLRYAGLGSAIDAGAVATGVSPTRRPSKRQTAPERPDPEREAAATRARAALAAARKEMATVSAALASADGQVRDAEGQLAAARRGRVAARQEVQRAERELRHAEQEAQRVGPESPKGP